MLLIIVYAICALANVIAGVFAFISTFDIQLRGHWLAKKVQQVFIVFIWLELSLLTLAPILEGFKYYKNSKADPSFAIDWGMNGAIYLSTLSFLILAWFTYSYSQQHYNLSQKGEKISEVTLKPLTDNICLAWKLASVALLMVVNMSLYQKPIDEIYQSFNFIAYSITAAAYLGLTWLAQYSAMLDKLDQDIEKAKAEAEAA